MLSIIVPTFHEAENIQPLVRRIRAALASTLDYEIIFVDDNSQDGTVAQIEGLSREGVPVRVIVRDTERGLSSAVLRGFREARGDLLLCMDADLSHPPESIPLLVETIIQQQADLVVGSRYITGGSIPKGWGIYRWLNSHVALGLARPLTSIRDSTAGFFLLPRRIFEQGRDIHPLGYKILLEISVKCPCRKVVEVPIQFADRQFGRSKLNFREQLLFLLHLKRLYDYRFPRASRLIQYCIISLTGAGVNLLMLAVLLHCGMPLKAAFAFAIFAGLLWSFGPNRWLTFDLAARSPILAQFGRFMLVGSIGAVINWLISVSLFNLLSGRAGGVYWAALGGVAAGMTVDYFVSSHLTLRNPVLDN